MIESPRIFHVETPVNPIRGLPAAITMGIVAASGGSCAAIGPGTPEFGSPEATVRSFVAAFLRDDPVSEYRCLAESFKEREGATLEQYILARGRLEESLGGARTLARAGVVRPRFRVESQDARRSIVEIEAGGRSATFLLEAEGFYRVTPRSDAPPIEGTIGNLDSALRGSGGVLEARVSDREAARLPPGGVREFHLGEEWKIADIRAPGGGPSS